MTESFSTDSEDQNVFGEMRRHTYSIPDNVEPVWQDIQKKPQFDEWQDALKRINEHEISKDFNKLSIAAKGHYIVSWKGNGTYQQVRQVAKEYEWDVSENDIESVSTFLTALGLVTADEST